MLLTPRRALLIVVAVAALVLAGVAAASEPGACPAGDPAGLAQTVKAQITAAGFTKIKGFCTHVGVYWSDLWRLDCTYQATWKRSGSPKLAKAQLVHGQIVRAGFYGVQPNGSTWIVSYEDNEANACPVSRGSEVSEYVRTNFG